MEKKIYHAIGIDTDGLTIEAIGVQSEIFEVIMQWLRNGAVIMNIQRLGNCGKI